MSLRLGAGLLAAAAAITGLAVAAMAKQRRKRGSCRTDDAMRHLVHLPPADSEPVMEPLGRLVAVLIGANTYTHHPDLRFAANDARAMASTLAGFLPEEQDQQLHLLTSAEDARELEVPASKSEIISTLAEVARTTHPEDRIIVFFAGHGCLIDRSVHLVPADADDSPGSMLSLSEIDEQFEQCSCFNRLLLIDCCQSPASGAARSAETSGDGHVVRSWSAGSQFAGECLDVLDEQLQLARSWTVLAACDRGEFSYETPLADLTDELAEDHGLFTHFLACGLQGDADLDGDGKVGLGELVQYVCTNVPSRVRAIHGDQASQHPTVIWRGAMLMTLTKVKGPKPAGSTFRLWLRRLVGRWPDDVIGSWDRFRFGPALLYGGLLVLEVLLLGGMGTGWVIKATLAGVAGACCWLASLALSAAASDAGRHGLGYVAGASLAFWHLLLGVLAPFGSAATAEARAAFALDLALEAGLLVILGSNALHLILNMAELLRRREDGVFRKFVGNLRKRWFDALTESTVPVVPVRPAVYGWLFGLVVPVYLLVHSLAVMIRPAMAGPLGPPALLVTRNLVLITMVLWLVCSFASMFKHLEARYVSPGA